MIYPLTTVNTRLQPILREIVWHKKQEVTQMHQQMSLASLQRQLTAAPTVRDFLTALQQNPSHPALIAEVQKTSPLYGNIRIDFDPIAIAKAYEQGGAACISVFTETAFFHGSWENLRAIRQRVALPLLCKEFIIDPCQIYLARAAGADAVVLIAAILTDRELQDFLRVIHYLGMNALVEVHNLSELDRVLKLDDIRLIGINNQNLEDFTIDLSTTQQMLAARRSQLQNLGVIVVSESGLYTNADLSLVAEAGVNAVIVGESLIKQDDIEMAVRCLIKGD
ncbi:indole-3-glycerol phosphate synthase TrpC [Umezakia ovalisporum]|jgi:indole-3-glycerol phosphate synthase|uniref:Indole-3-glycerol phosphate synthase n=1 Tax=Umezakia ovalisporum FSS-43 TaxID=2740520 RepID=A0ABT6K8A0_9CYAN|nr:indole-3-glycerol phosphate synthase TrpC [Umezakia ovalisporum]MDH6058649.1 indole-3-glycerol phosphate synthase TrpC [Umezakia ovalisporum FSS-43]MDH6066774.1 indole-3-glycerol phosphate synthase TrpC [Umezakia ovalisporum APH033B]MDH6070455.1 indole-3-glycerol phosphate synthase TrpC [Umezakia ovalisporum CobakiLakeA]MDH6073968.1 indole-3-glycerol phosphate synthase TrpC [Umezakia ovalisporum CS-1034]MDH6079661.1 indole-3-glycerol phosphate synthase TrpC [Umezakia ovalisporum FSS-45]